MKLIDKFLKKLNTNRNTFMTFVLTLLTVYFAVDRIVEMLFMLFTGASLSYWGPIKYTLVLACPTFAFLFSGTSAFATSKQHKVTLFYTYLIGLYIIAVSMFTQWINMGCWFLFISVPNYVEIVEDFKDLILPAFRAISIYLPLVTIMPFIKWIILSLDDSTEIRRSLWDYKGIDLSDKSQGHGIYTCDVDLFKDAESGKTVTFAEAKRFQALLVCGGSGSGKTSLVFEPFIAKDLEKKLFFFNVSKEMGYTALKTGLATLNCPYDNEYINEHFSLNMLVPVTSKENLYKAYMKKMLLSSAPYIYRDLGLSYIAPDYETIQNIEKICKNFKLKYNIIDPSNPNSIGMNPFVYDDISKIANTINSVIREIYLASHIEESEEIHADDEDVTVQAIENISMLLKEMYPRMNQGNLPNLEDMLKILTNFDLAEKMCRVLEADEQLAEQYAVMLSYFKRNFYKRGKGREQTEEKLSFLATQLDKLIRLPGIKSTLCNRHNNVNFDKMLEEGQVSLVCTRRGDLGASSHKAFGLFYIIAMQSAVLSRPGSELTRIPHFLYIDEFPEFLCRSIDTIFTMYRKYRVGAIVAIQSISQLSVTNSKLDLQKTILSNCANKIFTGNAEIDEIQWWSNEFGKRRKWVYSSSMDMSKLEYDSKVSGVKWDWELYFPLGKLQYLGITSCGYAIRDDNNRPMVGEGKLKPISAKCKEEQIPKFYNFTKFTPGLSNNISDDDKHKKSKFKPENVNFDNNTDSEIDPIQTDASLLFDNQDAIVVDFKKKTNE